MLRPEALARFGWETEHTINARLWRHGASGTRCSVFPFSFASSAPLREVILYSRKINSPMIGGQRMRIKSRGMQGIAGNYGRREISN